jgi:hypothetical protein
MHAGLCKQQLGIAEVEKDDRDKGQNTLNHEIVNNMSSGLS